MIYARILACLATLIHTATEAEITLWKIGGSGLEWAKYDSVAILVDQSTAPGALQPIYIRPDRSVFSYLANWGDWNPRELGYVDGERPRVAVGSIADMVKKSPVGSLSSSANRMRRCLFSPTSTHSGR